MDRSTLNQHINRTWQAPVAPGGALSSACRSGCSCNLPGSRDGPICGTSGAATSFQLQVRQRHRVAHVVGETHDSERPLDAAQEFSYECRSALVPAIGDSYVVGQLQAPTHRCTSLRRANPIEYNPVSTITSSPRPGYIPRCTFVHLSTWQAGQVRSSRKNSAAKRRSSASHVPRMRAHLLQLITTPYKVVIPKGIINPPHGR